MEVGKLYRCEEYFLMLYPDQETASTAPRASASAAAPCAAPAYADFWSKRFGKPVSYTEKNIPLLVLDSKEKFYEVLAGEKKGWIIDQDWLNLKELP